MNKTLTFDTSDEVYVALQAMAVRQGRPFEELTLPWLLMHRPKPRGVCGEFRVHAALRHHRGTHYGPALRTGRVRAFDEGVKQHDEPMAKTPESRP